MSAYLSFIIAELKHEDLLVEKLQIDLMFCEEIQRLIELSEIEFLQRTLFIEVQSLPLRIHMRKIIKSSDGGKIIVIDGDGKIFIAVLVGEFEKKTQKEVFFLAFLAQKADVLIANEEDIQNCLGLPLKNFTTPAESYRHLCEDVKNEFPNIKIVAVTLRHSYSADRNGWSAVLSGKSGFYESAQYDIENIVERVGAGDSFSAGLIYGLSEFSCDSFGEAKALDFATAASCLKHSICGDFNLATKEEIENLMNGNGTGRIQR